MTAPEFRVPPAPKFYSPQEFPGHYESGMLSPYGEQLLFVTDYVASKKSVDGASMSLAMLEWATSFGGRPDHALTTFIENMSKEGGKWPNCGANDNQAHIYTKVVPITCLYAGKPERPDMVEEAIRVHQNNDEAVAFGLAASHFLEGVLLGDPMDKILKESVEQANVIVGRAFSAAHDAAAESKSLKDLLGEVGRHCGLPASFIGPVRQIHGALTNGTVANNGLYVDAVRENIRAGGDTCGRSIFVGAIFAAAGGGPPDHWLGKVDKKVLEKVDGLANYIADTAVGFNIPYWSW